MERKSKIIIIFIHLLLFVHFQCKSQVNHEYLIDTLIIENPVIVVVSKGQLQYSFYSSKEKVLDGLKPNYNLLYVGDYFFISDVSDGCIEDYVEDLPYTLSKTLVVQPLNRNRIAFAVAVVKKDVYQKRMQAIGERSNSKFFKSDNSFILVAKPLCDNSL